jgi:hypothetical protein
VTTTIKTPRRPRSLHADPNLMMLAPGDWLFSAEEAIWRLHRRQHWREQDRATGQWITGAIWRAFGFAGDINAPFDPDDWTPWSSAVFEAGTMRECMMRIEDEQRDYEQERALLTRIDDLRQDLHDFKGEVSEALRRIDARIDALYAESYEDHVR